MFFLVRLISRSSRSLAAMLCSARLANALAWQARTPVQDRPLTLPPRPFPAVPPARIASDQPRRRST